MKATQTNQRGFGFIGLLLVLVVIGAIALIGLRVMELRNASSIVSDSTKGQTAVPPKITNAAELQSAATALDTTNVDQVDLNQLDSDISSLL